MSSVTFADEKHERDELRLRTITISLSPLTSIFLFPVLHSTLEININNYVSASIVGLYGVQRLYDSSKDYRSDEFPRRYVGIGSQSDWYYSGSFNSGKTLGAGIEYHHFEAIESTISRNRGARVAFDFYFGFKDTKSNGFSSKLNLGVRYSKSIKRIESYSGMELTPGEDGLAFLIDIRIGISI